MRDDDGLRLNFVATVDWVRRRAEGVRLGDARLLIANLSSVLKSKRAAGRPREAAAPRVRLTRKAKLEALKLESDLALRDQIRRFLALPPDRRTHFLRKRVAYRISCL